MTNQNTLNRISVFEFSTLPKFMRYDAFGKVRWQSQTDTRNKNTFVGGHGIVDDSDDDGLIYMRARYYDSEIGRFISRDPIGKNDDLNEYRYVGNNPITVIDITGLAKLSCKEKAKVQEAIDKLRGIGLEEIADMLEGLLNSDNIRKSYIMAKLKGANAYVTPWSDKINVSSKYLKTSSIDNLAATLAHESMHLQENAGNFLHRWAQAKYGEEGTAGSSVTDMVLGALQRQHWRENGLLK